MADDLAHRFVTRQLDLTTAELVLAAERLAEDARHYADRIAAGRHGNGAHRLAQDAAQLALVERRLAGMREIAALILPAEPPTT